VRRIGLKSTRASWEGWFVRNLSEAPLLAFISFTPTPPLPGGKEGGRKAGREEGDEENMKGGQKARRKEAREGGREGGRASLPMSAETAAAGTATLIEDSRPSGSREKSLEG
jgi:hypothetical protein